jgi:O-antigen/teichoic acid export membrane protein
VTACLAIVLSIGVASLAVPRLGISGVTAASSAMHLFLWLAMAVLLARRIGPAITRNLVSTLLRAACCSALGLLACLPSFGRPWGDLVLGSTGFIVIYAVAARMIAREDSDRLVGILRHLLRKGLRFGPALPGGGT